MAIFYKNFRRGFINSAPLLLLYFLSITELDTEFSNYFEILSFNCTNFISEFGCTLPNKFNLKG